MLSCTLAIREVHESSLLFSLQHDEVIVREWDVFEQLAHILGLYVKLLDCLVAKNIACCTDCHNLCVLIEDFEEHWAMKLALGIPVKVKLEEV